MRVEGEAEENAERRISNAERPNEKAKGEGQRAKAVEGCWLRVEGQALGTRGSTTSGSERAIEVNRPYLGPGDEAELVVLLQMRMSGKDANAESVSAGFTRRN